MGLFDSVYAPCPACGKDVEFQTKAMPDPYLRRFPLKAVPLPAALDMNDQEGNCQGCGALLRITSDYPLPQTAPMSVHLLSVPSVEGSPAVLGGSEPDAP